MSAVASAAEFASSTLPETLPIFPLPGVVLLPQARLPLNIFEPRYLAMVESALGAGRIIGMIQPSGPLQGVSLQAALQNPANAASPVYRVGCAGRITSFTETDGGRFLVALTGMCRFTVVEELPQDFPWRRVRADWGAYLGDLKPAPDAIIDRPRLSRVLQPYFREEGITLERNVIENAPDDVLISSLAMICPLEPSEKQALLETPDLSARAELLTALLEMACMTGQGEGESGAKH